MIGTYKINVTRNDFLQWAYNILGNFYFPITEFNLQYRTLQANNPELSPEAAAAIVYFSMLAETPRPSTTTPVFIPVFDGDWTAQQMAESESAIVAAPDVLYPQSWGLSTLTRMESGLARGQTGFIEIAEGRASNEVNDTIRFNAVFLPKNEAWEIQRYKLELYLIKRNLWTGVKKTLNEQSRQAQAEAAAASASKASAAYAAAAASMAKQAAEEARIEAARQEAAALEELKKSQREEAELQKKLSNLAQGLPEDYEAGNGAGKILFIGWIAAAAVYLLTRKKKGAK